jgi:hypothetical protein
VGGILYDMQSIDEGQNSPEKATNGPQKIQSNSEDFSKIHMPQRPT